jgi:hypothetical protein
MNDPCSELPSKGMIQDIFAAGRPLATAAPSPKAGSAGSAGHGLCANWLLLNQVQLESSNDVSPHNSGETFHSNLSIP